jgi:hypothetical protein
MECCPARKISFSERIVKDAAVRTEDGIPNIMSCEELDTEPASFFKEGNHVVLGQIPSVERDP